MEDSSVMLILEMTSVLHLATSLNTGYDFMTAVRIRVGDFEDRIAIYAYIPHMIFHVIKARCDVQLNISGRSTSGCTRKSQSVSSRHV